MLTLREKHEYEQEIAYLKSELKAASKVEADLNTQMKKLEARVCRAKRNQQYTKVKLKKSKGNIRKEKLSRSDRALKVIALRYSHKSKVSLKQLAIDCFLSYSTVRGLSSQYKKAIESKNGV